jgi:hypothetical protein
MSSHTEIFLNHGEDTVYGIRTLYSGVCLVNIFVRTATLAYSELRKLRHISRILHTAVGFSQTPVTIADCLGIRPRKNKNFFDGCKTALLELSFPINTSTVCEFTNQTPQ